MNVLCTMQSSAIAIDYRSILRVALPMSLGAFIQFIVVFTDNYFVAQIDGRAMSAVSYIGLAYVMLTMITTGISSALQILVARRVGENNLNAIPSLLSNGLSLGIIIASIQFISLYFITPILLPHIIHDDITIQYMNEFIQFRSWGFWVYTPTLMLQGYWTGIAKTRPILYAMLITSICNIVLDYFLVKGHWIFPAWGVAGAAIATLASEVFAFLYLSGFTILNKNQSISYPDMLKFQFSKCKPMLKLGLPLVFQMLIALGVWMAFYTLIESRGSASLQSAFIVRNMYMLCWVSVMGFSSATRTYISTLIAEKNFQHIPSVILKMFLFNLFGVLLLSHGLWLYPHWITHQFTNDPQIISLTIQSMYIIVPAIVIYSFTSILLAVVEGSGSTMAGFWIEVITSFCYVIFIYSAVHFTDWNVALLWTSDYVYFSVLGICSSFFLVKRPWKQKVI
jgi:MATE family multidrug resistance protein